MQDNDLLLKIGRVSGEFKRMFHIVLDESGFDGIKGGGRILFELSKENGLSQKELATRMQIRPQSLTGVLEKLETEGLIDRVRSTTDKREQNVFITESGKKQCSVVYGCRCEAASKLMSPLSEEEKEELDKLLGKILAN